ncbi:MAG: putative Mg2+ transporter-C (MgtC) family protein [Acidobacteriota bacterium]|nr:putative Mg2+ transporter-C (MgtC) family protein [Acidobacteriota bacterium]
MEIEIILKILLSAVLGGIIGFERELSRKDTDLRTCILIAVSSTLVTILSLKMGDISKSVDPTRLTGYIIIAIGLLGAGAIVRARFTANGLTTAAIIWVVAAAGISVGSGYYLTALIVTAFVLVVLTSLKYISNFLENQAQTFAYVIATEDRASVLIEIKKITRELDLKYIDSRLRKVNDGYEIEISLSTSKTKNEAFVEKVMQLPGVKEIISEHL